MELKKIFLMFIIFLSLGFSAFATTDDAIAYYSFDSMDVIGLNPLDLSGNENDGTGNSIITGVSGKLNEAFDLGQRIKKQLIPKG